MPSPLDGLNVVYPAQPVTDSHELITGDPSQIDSSLEIWHRLPFNLEEGSDSIREKKKESGDAGKGKEEESGNTDNHHASTSTVYDSTVPNFWSQTQPAPTIDSFQALLATLAATGALQQQPSFPQAPTPSLAQLLAQHTASMGLLPPFANVSPLAPSSLPATRTAEDPASLPSAKRARTRKTSVSTGESIGETAPSPDDATSVTPLSAAEDKRRRNTAASARFRARKKEREMALEAKAKELEVKVNGLERECETLRRENNWLKGLVVGVTGAATQNTPSI